MSKKSLGIALFILLNMNVYSSQPLQNEKQNIFSVITSIRDIQNLILQYSEEWGLYKDLGVHNSPISSVVVTSPLVNVKYLASSSKTGIIKLWNMDKKSNFGECTHTLNTNNILHSIACTQDGKYLCHTSNADIIIIDMDKFSSKYGQEVCTIKGAELISNTYGRHIYRGVGHRDFTIFLSVSSNNKYLASGSSDLNIKIWDIERDSKSFGKLLHTLNGHAKTVTALDFSPCNKYLASGSADTNIHVWDLYSEKLLYELNEHQNLVSSVVYSPCGRLIVSGSYDTTIKIWHWNDESKTWACSHTLTGHNEAVQDVKFSNDGKYLASASNDNTVRIWDMDLKSKTYASCIQTLAHDYQVYCVTFMDDNKFIVTGSSDNKIKVWMLLSEFLKKEPSS